MTQLTASKRFQKHTALTQTRKIIGFKSNFFHSSLADF